MDMSTEVKMLVQLADMYKRGDMTRARLSTQIMVSLEAIKNHGVSHPVSNLFKPCTSCKYLRKIVADSITVDMWGCDKSGMYITTPGKFSCQSHTNDC